MSEREPSLEAANSLSAVDRVNMRWVEIGRNFPTSNEESALIFGALSQLAGGKSTEECLEGLLSEKLRNLFRELASAYTSQE